MLQRFSYEFYPFENVAPRTYMVQMYGVPLPSELEHDIGGDSFYQVLVITIPPMIGEEGRGGGERERERERERG